VKGSRGLARLAVLLAVALLGCSSGVETGPSATTSDPLAGGTPTPTTPSGTPLTPSPRPATTAPTTSGAPLAWQYMADFPAGEAFLVASVAAPAGGFAAVGAEPAPGQDIEGVRQGVVWRSTGGSPPGWQRVADPMFSGATLLHAVELDGRLYVLGYLSPCPAGDDVCAAESDAGIAVWRATDDGGFESLPRDRLMRDALTDGCLGALGKLVCFGSAGDEVAATVWLSDEGVIWQASSALGGMDQLTALAAGGPGIVAFGTQYDAVLDRVDTRAAVSTDGTTFEPALLPAGLAATITDVASGPAGLLAVGYEEDAETGAVSGVVLRSADGLTWSGGAAPSLRGVRAQSVLALADGYLVLGPMPDDPSDARAPLVAWRSSDGTTWQLAGRLEDASVSELTAAVAAEQGVVVFGVDFGAELSDPAVVHAWFTPLPGEDR
jgi:hypothetical protein